MGRRNNLNPLGTSLQYPRVRPGVFQKPRSLILVLLLWVNRLNSSIISSIVCLLLIFPTLLCCGARVRTGSFILKVDRVHCGVPLSDFLSGSILLGAAWHGRCPLRPKIDKRCLERQRHGRYATQGCRMESGGKFQFGLPDVSDKKR